MFVRHIIHNNNIFIHRKIIPNSQLSDSSFFFTVNVTLDGSTAHPNLEVDEKTMRWTGVGTDEPYVLGTIGRGWTSYWEVDVKDKVDWVLGVARETAVSGGKLDLSRPDRGYWFIRLSNGETLKAKSPKTADDDDCLSDEDIPEKVGVELDYRNKKVTFYNPLTGSVIHTFDDGPDYEDEVRPLFSPRNNNQRPIRILSIDPESKTN